MSAPSQPGLRVIVVLIAISVPMLLGIETLLRIHVIGPLYGPILTELRGYYWPELSSELLATRATRLAWILIAVTVVAGIIGIALLHRTVRRATGGEAEEATPEAKVRDTLLLMTSIPQVPGLISTLCLMVGGEPLPVLICVGVSTSFVVAQGFIGERLLESARPC
ncbi:hypothetical protein ENSA5_52600 [Enhygromyxa salina]|uniref:Uncharacterized protein n=1 Tax=Enhygromyxa salina TaxID=215803 RepID=A0A2S9XG41_9BACT|nr:hypothetical protein [Enhygromyxa salina]PRP91822.1 hypothetical protein ENSA5_52600 [Enhygromyxa salina]